MPWTDSSTVVARSPAWSWLRRATLLNRVRKRNPKIMIGTAAARKIRASCQLMANITATPITTVSVVTTSMMAPKAIQRRRKFRSVMARDSS